MIQKLPIALAQVKAGNTSENLLNKIRQIIYLLYWEKKLLKSYKTKWILYLWIPKIVGHLILIDYYLILQIK